MYAIIIVWLKVFYQRWIIMSYIYMLVFSVRFRYVMKSLTSFLPYGVLLRCFM